ncbi:MAG: 4Fe-4S binding protein [Alphaproteobacteria bacterium]
MASGQKKILICNCEGTMALDAKALGKALGADLPVHHQLCRAEIANFEAAASGGEPLLVCCTQEAPLFTETLDQAHPETEAAFTNIRERAGWSDDGAAALPKIAALIAEASLDVPPAGTITLKSEGRVLVLGHDETAIDAARRLADHLDASVLLSRPADLMPPAITTMALFKGTVAAASGHLGDFRVTVDDYAAPKPSSRRSLEFEGARNGVALEFDIILDLTRSAALFPAPEKRDGYFKVDAGDPAAVARALFDIVDLVGEFEKPRYVVYDKNICAHSRSGVLGCNRCIDTCPASAITPAGDYVAIDPHICGGCGGCASVCPTGAVTYALPPYDAMFTRLRTLLRSYREAGGNDAVLLVHDDRYGNELIGMMARFGRGLPARVVPFVVNEATLVGLDFLAAAIAYGAERVLVLVPPGRRGEADALQDQMDMLDTALSGLGHATGRAAIIDATDPDAVADQLYGLEVLAPIAPSDFLALGGKRSVMTMALGHLHDTAPEPQEIIALPAESPFGTVNIDTDGCTLCLACVGACPTGALTDNPDKPMLSFNEQACIQCGLCRNTCPESVMSLEARFNFGEDAKREILVKEEEPFECISCGEPFGGRSSIEATIARLKDHPMFSGDGNTIDQLRMCADCRIVAQFDQPAPLSGAPRPLTRTTDDYLKDGDGEEES